MYCTRVSAVGRARSVLGACARSCSSLALSALDGLASPVGGHARMSGDGVGDSHEPRRAVYQGWRH